LLVARQEVLFCKKEPKNSFDSWPWAPLPGASLVQLTYEPTPSWPRLTRPSTPFDLNFRRRATPENSRRFFSTLGVVFAGRLNFAINLVGDAEKEVSK
jgi:hypothetical protein